MKLLKKHSLLLLTLFAVAMFFAACDVRNAADLAPEIYKLIATVDTPGGALYVDAAGNYMAVAGAAFGTTVYEVSDPVNPDSLFAYVPPVPYFSVACVLDPINHLVCIAQNPSGPNLHKIFNFSNGTSLGIMRFTGIPIKLQLKSDLDSMIIWGTDPTDGFIADLWCKSSETEWSPGCPTVWTWLGGTGQRGFDVNSTHAAIAMNTYRVKIHDIVNNVELSATGTPGDPQDCAWLGSYVIVADNFYVTVLDATNNAEPFVAASIVIPGADRLRRVLIDNNFAVFLDDSDGLYVVDVSDPLHPSFKQSISLPEPAAISSNGEHLFVADQQLGVLIYSH